LVGLAGWASPPAPCRRPPLPALPIYLPACVVRLGFGSGSLPHHHLVPFSPSLSFSFFSFFIWFGLVSVQKWSRCVKGLFEISVTNRGVLAKWDQIEFLQIIRVPGPTYHSLFHRIFNSQNSPEHHGEQNWTGPMILGC